MADSAAGGTPTSVSEEPRVMMRSRLLVMKDGRLLRRGRCGKLSFSSKNVQLADSSNRTLLTGFAFGLRWPQSDVRLLHELALPLLRLSCRLFNVVVSADRVESTSELPDLKLKSRSMVNISSMATCFSTSTGSAGDILQEVMCAAAMAMSSRLSVVISRGLRWRAVAKGSR